MLPIFIRVGLLSLLCLSNVQAYSIFTRNHTNLAEQCRQLALKLDALSRQQKNDTCKFNLDGLNVYFASNYILNESTRKAVEVLENAIIQVKFAQDINCDGKKDIQEIIDGLQNISKKLNDD